MILYSWSHITVGVADRNVNTLRCWPKKLSQQKCVLNWRLVHAGGQGGDNRLGGTVKCHCGTSRNCHHFERARGWSEEGIIYFQSQAAVLGQSCFPSIIMWNTRSALFRLSGFLTTHKRQTEANYYNISVYTLLRNMGLCISTVCLSI